MHSGTMGSGRDLDQGVSGKGDEVHPNHYASLGGMLIQRRRNGYFVKRAYWVLLPLNVIRGWKVIQ
jgi:hypothetical protein